MTSLPSLSSRAAVAVLALALLPASALAEARRAISGGQAAASVGIRVVVPPVLQVLENVPQHRLEQDATGAWRGQQRLVVVSNLRRGFCAHLRAAATDASGWSLDTGAQPGVLTERVADGWRICSLRAGRQQLELQHRFPPAGTAPAWPVATDITAL